MRRPRILIVDDEPAIRRALSRYLHRHGCDVETAAHGLEGLDQLGRDSFDAVVSDVQMPRMDGVAFRSAALERQPRLRDRFLLCSSLPLPMPLATDPTVHFLPKPFDGTELWEALTSLLTPRPEAGRERALTDP